jgi:hypothetical protein
MKTETDEKIMIPNKPFKKSKQKFRKVIGVVPINKLSTPFRKTPSRLGIINQHDRESYITS